MNTRNPIIRQFGRLRMVAVMLTALPLVLLPVMGMVWLWQSNMRVYWILALLGCGISGYGLHILVKYFERRRMPLQETRPNPTWPPSADECWTKVEKLAREVSPNQWPVNDPEKLALLGQNTLELVARHYHPDRNQPLLELTVPHALLIIESASRDLRIQIMEHVPFSHQLTVGTLIRANRGLEIIKSYENWYRVLRSIADPASALFIEIRRAMGKNIMDHGFEIIKTWLLREYVRKTGYYAIQLYSGQLLLTGESPATDKNSASDPQNDNAGIFHDPKTELLRILVLGRANAGKSALINALFGKLISPTDVLPLTTREITPYLLEREGQIKALVFDAPGIDTEKFSVKILRDNALRTDLILFATPANRADRHLEREHMEMIRGWFAQTPSRRPPPMLAVVTHIDRLRPPREWNPPYDLNNPKDKKAENIASAVATIASDLNLSPSLTIPVCLAPDRLYNVEDTLWAAIMELQDEAGKVRYLRCLQSRRKEENWALIWKQLSAGGRVLTKLPERFFSSKTI